MPACSTSRCRSRYRLLKKSRCVSRSIGAIAQILTQTWPTLPSPQRIREEREFHRQEVERRRRWAVEDDEKDDVDYGAAGVASGSKRQASSKGKGKGRAGGRKRSRPNGVEEDVEGDESLWWRYLTDGGGYDVVLCSYAWVGCGRLV